MSVIGVDLGGTNLRVGLLQGDQVLWKRALPTEAARGPGFIVERICELIGAALQASREIGQLVVGVGIGCPGPVNPFIGQVDNPPNLPGWEQVPLRDLLASRFCLPIYVNNDANSAALGEWLYGAGRGHDHVVYVTLSTGIGGGVVSERTLLIGAHGGAAEIGHICLQAVAGEGCSCGRRGCFEAYASGTAMVRRTQERLLAANTKPSLLREVASITPKEIAWAAGQGDELAAGIMAESQYYLAVGLANVLTIYNPSVLILGGGLTNLWSELVAPAVEAMRRLTFAPGAAELLVTRPQLGEDSGLIGAAALVTYHQNRRD